MLKFTSQSAAVSISLIAVITDTAAASIGVDAGGMIPTILQLLLTFIYVCGTYIYKVNVQVIMGKVL